MQGAAASQLVGAVDEDADVAAVVAEDEDAGVASSSRTGTFPCLRFS